MSYIFCTQRDILLMLNKLFASPASLFIEAVDQCHYNRLFGCDKDDYLTFLHILSFFILKIFSITKKKEKWLLHTIVLKSTTLSSRKQTNQILTQILHFQLIYLPHKTYVRYFLSNIWTSVASVAAHINYTTVN